MLDKLTFQELREKFWVLYEQIFEQGNEREHQRENQGVAENSPVRS